MSDFLAGLGEISENPRSIKTGCLLIVPPQHLAGSHRQTAEDFMSSLGGDAETYILIMGMDPENNVVYGIPIGTQGPIKPPFMPNWGVDQLCEEIGAGIWHVAHANHPEYAGEVKRRLAGKTNLGEANNED